MIDHPDRADSFALTMTTKSMRATPRILIAGLAALAFVAASCGDDESGATTITAPNTTAPGSSTATGSTMELGSTTDDVSGPLTVFAAASLTAAFEDIGEEFTAANPDAEVTFNFAASSELVTQINEGAPADVYASADQNNMTKLVDAGGNEGEPELFVTNVLEIVVQPDNPEGIAGVEDLANEELIVVTCAEEVPCGTYAAEIFANAGVTVTPKSFEENVKAVLNKVVLGEADAGVVYRTDVLSAGADAEGVEIPEDINVIAEYPIVATTAAENPQGAAAFIEFVQGDVGQAILAAYGFAGP